ncbi:hypothetical protein WS51_22725 [Burkholderia territorii]|nr:hypothetical protein WS51_22725 [Burkholderia territorii]KWF97023.1 hypothetical protein WL95_09655 [Burkholderia cepacia]
MGRHLPQPCNARILHRRIGVEATGDGVRDGGLALFCKQGEELFLLGNKYLDFCRLASEKVGYTALFAKRRHHYLQVT